MSGGVASPNANLLSGVLDALDGGAVLLDTQALVTAVNRRAAHAGVRIGQPAAAAFEVLLPGRADEQTLLVSGLQSVLDGVQHRFEVQVPARDERHDGARVALARIADDAGVGVGAVVHLTAMRAATTGVARSGDASFRTIFDSTLIAMLITDAQGQVLAINPSARTLLHRDDDAAATPMAFGHLFSASTAPPSAAEAWQGMLRDGHWRGESRMLIGEHVRVLDLSALAHITPGRHLISIRDVTDAQQMEAQLRQAQKMEAIGLLTGGMAHDFNNLLTVILANSDMVLDELPAAHGELREELLQIVQAATRGTEMVKKLLAFSRQEALERRPVALEVVLAETHALLVRLLPSNIQIRLDVAPDLPGVMADPGAIQHMLLNLATNARDAMATGGTLVLRGRYDEHVEQADGTMAPMVTLAVQDTGRGMPKEVLDHLFEPFFTTKAPGEGTGLGMAMIYGLIQQHAGTIHVHSVVDQGTTVTIGLPLAEITLPDRTPRSSVIVRDGARETILLVEDEEMVRRAGRRILEKHGYTVLQAADGAEALDLLRARGNEIALVVSDVVMPRMGGRELHASLRDEGFRMPFLFTSGYTDRMSSDTVALDPSVPVLPKPWTWSELTASVRAALDEGASLNR
jgi:two-component system, cell cycle sensor histidine kinase and response regulator CckA